MSIFGHNLIVLLLKTGKICNMNERMNRYIIPNLKNACMILKHMGATSRSFTCLEISNALKLPRTSVIRIMETLAQEGFLSKADGSYTLGSALSALGDCTLARTNILKLADPHLKNLTEATGETSQLGIPSGTKVLIAKVCESPLPLHAASRAGALVDMHCSGTGKVLLAYICESDPSFLKKIRLDKRTQNTICSATAMNKELALIRKRGYAIDNQEYHLGVRCLAVPIKDASGATVASIGITAPAMRFSPSKDKKMYEIVGKAAAEFEERLGAKQNLKR